MKSFLTMALIVSALLSFGSAFAYPGSSVLGSPTCGVQLVKSIMESVSSKKSLSCSKPDEIVERRGCCSWHGGVCGCSMGSAQCCDGTLSPSCGCD
jgi:hypothetical protein